MTQIETFTSNLEYLAVLEVTGNDATTFLQAQLTSDIATIEPDGSQFSSWCSPQGRIITTMLVHKRNDTYFILLPNELKDTFQKNISIYILRSKVMITAREDLTHIMAISGEELIQKIKNSFQTAKFKEALLVEIPDGKNNRSILVSKESLQGKINQIDTNINDVLVENWKNLDIESGVVWITAETSNKLLPQDINLERLKALSYNKGCYPGQEIIARLHFRGKEKYGLYKGTISSDQKLPDIGGRLYLADDSASCGMIVATTKNEYDGNNCLASLKHEISDVTSYSLDNEQTMEIIFSSINEN